MKYTLGEAAKATGKSKAAISRALKNGVISAEKLKNGSYKIDPAELHRVYPPVKAEQATQPLHVTLNETEDLARIREIEAKLEAAELRLRDKDEVIGDLRRRLDAESEERRRTQAQLMGLLADQRQELDSAPVETPKKGFFRRLFRG